MALRDPESLRLIVVSNGREYDFNTHAQGVVHSTKINGGDYKATWKLEHSRVKSTFDHVLPPLVSSVRLEDEDGIFWNGVLTGHGISPFHEGADLDYTALGYSVFASLERYRTSKIFNANQTNGQIMIQALTELGQGRLASIAAYVQLYQTLISETEDFKGQTLDGVLNAMTSYGDGASRPSQWRIGSLPGWIGPFLQAHPVPTTPRYQVALGLGGVEGHLRTDLMRVVNRVTVVWTETIETGPPEPGAESVTEEIEREYTVSDLTNYHELGNVWIDRVINVANEIANQADAAAYAFRVMNEMRGIKAAGDQITVHWPIQITDMGGAPVWPWRVQAGEIIRISDLSTDVGWLTTDFYLVETSYDHHSRIWTGRIGEPGDVRLQALRRAIASEGSRLASSGGGVNSNIPRSIPGGTPAGFAKSRDQDKGKKGGVTPLDENGKVPIEHLPSAEELLAGSTSDVNFICVYGPHEEEADQIAGQGGDLVVSFPCEIVAYAALANENATLSISVQYGQLSAYPGTTGSLLVSLSGQRVVSATLETPIQLVPPSTGGEEGVNTSPEMVLQFLPSDAFSNVNEDVEQVTVYLKLRRLG